MATGARKRTNSSASQMELLHRASESITRAMAIIPETQLATAIHRGFRVWPYRVPPTEAFLVPVLQTVVDQIRETVSAEMAALGVGRFPNQPFDPWVVSGVSEDLRSSLGVPCPIGTLGAVAVEGKIVRVKDIRKHPQFRGFPEGHPQILSFMALPIRFDSLSLGNLYIGNKIGSEEFSKEDEWVAETLARLAGFAIQQTYIQATVEIQHSQVQALLDSVPSGILFVDKETGNITANNVAMDLFGRALTENGGSAQYRQLLAREDGSEVEYSELPSSKALAGKTVLGQEMRVKCYDGTVIPVRINSAPVHGTFRQIIGAVVVFENISREKNLEQIRQQMVAMVVHDIRNPIQAILMNAHVIRTNPRIDDGIAKQALLIEENSKRIVGLTDRLLETSRIQSGQISLELKEAELREFVERVIARASCAYPEHRVEVHLPKQSVRVKMDSERMERVLTNLIDNAAKYSPKGSRIEVKLNVEISGFEISVRDHGRGLEPEILAQIFEPYKRGAMGQRDVPGGLGLGLFIVKGIVEAHGGTVTVESKVGEGCLFRLHFPPSLRKQISAA